MTLTEILKSNGVADDAISAIATAMKENRIYTANEENLDLRYGKLKTDHDAKLKELGEANGLIDELKKSTKGNEELQGKITGYEAQVASLQRELVQTKTEAAIKVALLSEKAADIDYLTFKLKEKGELELDENGDIKGWGDKLSSLKTQFPAQFENGSARKVDEHKLDKPDTNHTLTKADILKKPYAERILLFNENQEAYNEAMKG